MKNDFVRLCFSCLEASLKPNTTVVHALREARMFVSAAECSTQPRSRQQLIGGTRSRKLRFKTEGAFTVCC